MVGRLVTLPLRVWVRGTQMAFGVAERAAVSAVHVVGGVTRRRSASSEQAPPPQTQSRVREPARRPAREEASTQTSETTSETVEPATPPETAAVRTSDTAPIVSAPQPENVEAPTAPAPVHVSEEADLVREEAEPGAEEGAGASVTVRPPWDGYERMAAREVIARLGDATAAELAAVQLYESSNRSRQTVLEAVERRLNAANGRAS
jgi:hypothetical protein